MQLSPPVHVGTIVYDSRGNRQTTNVSEISQFEESEKLVGNDQIESIQVDIPEKNWGEDGME